MKLFKGILASLVLGTAGLSVLVSSEAIAGDFRSKSLKVGETLSVNEYVPYRINGTKYMLLLQGDGNLVVYNEEAYFEGRGGQTALWASGTMPYIEFVTYRHGQIVFYDDRNNAVRDINIGHGGEVCLGTSTYKPMGCN